MTKLITEANSLLRSAYQIALRNGESTNWEAFKNSVYKELVREHNKDTRTCQWKRIDDDNNTWAGECGIEFNLESNLPEENAMRYCPNCGKILEACLDNDKGD